MDWLLNFLGIHPREIAENAIRGAVNDQPWYQQMMGAIEDGSSVITGFFINILDMFANWICDQFNIGGEEDTLLQNSSETLEALGQDANVPAEQQAIFTEISEVVDEHRTRGMDRLADAFTMGEDDAQQTNRIAGSAGKKVFYNRYTSVVSQLLAQHAGSQAQADEILRSLNMNQVFQNNLMFIEEGDRNDYQRLYEFAQTYPEIHAAAMEEAQYYSGMQMALNADGTYTWNEQTTGVRGMIINGGTDFVAPAGAVPLGARSPVASDAARLQNMQAVTTAFASAPALFSGLTPQEVMALQLDTSAQWTNTAPDAGAGDNRITEAEVSVMAGLTDAQKSRLNSSIQGAIGVNASARQSVLVDIDIDAAAGTYTIYAHDIGDPSNVRSTPGTL